MTYGWFHMVRHVLRLRHLICTVNTKSLLDKSMVKRLYRTDVSLPMYITSSSAYYANRVVVLVTVRMMIQRLVATNGGWGSLAALIIILTVSLSQFVK